MQQVAPNVWNNQWQRPSPRSYKLLFALIVVGVIAFSGVASAFLANPPHPAVHTTPTTITTYNPPNDWHSYVRLVSTNAKLLSTDTDATSAGCQTNQFQCRLAIGQLDTDTHSFLDALNSQVAPACLLTADGYLHHALQLYDQGAQQIEQGLDTSSAAFVKKGASKISQGNGYLTKTTNAVDAAVCGK